MSVSAVRAHLSEFGRADDVIELPGSSATVELAAAGLGVEPARIAKTLSLYASDQRSAILVVAAGDARLVSGAFKRRFGHKARFLAPDDVEPLTGHPIGGVCPFGNPDGAEVWLDESLRRFDRVYPAAGAAHTAIGVEVDELETLTGAVGWVEVTRLGEPAQGGAA
ncbi:YbaK/EbsC family protein [Microbacterium betulae]|uniref:YbaK/EbsC family protein n=1 Tax=Microbacterium betulae TaxID=2981139 RepID=A0AA97FJ66_9MICO|nr:YbaK/EbsC family protein [Microbacterium sp. AB]WOF22522.1 YbaK/EbsC family protein [Microbacterium sp. AB]